MFALIPILTILGLTNAQGYQIPSGGYIPEHPYGIAPPTMEPPAPVGSITSLEQLASLNGELPAYDPRYPASEHGYLVPVWVNEGEEVPQTGPYQWVDPIAGEQQWPMVYNPNAQLPLVEATPGIVVPPNHAPFMATEAEAAAAAAAAPYYYAGPQ